MEPQIRYKEKSVIIHRDENGFGLRVGGQNPVFVDCVHENGAAWKAGVRKDDRIIKVNGTLVKSYDHQRVVQMIQNCTPFVNLTLHSPEPVVADSFASLIPGILQSSEPIGSASLTTKSSSSLHLSMSNNNLSNNLVSSSMHHVHPMHHNPHHHRHQHHPNAHHQRRHYTHPHSLSNNLNWLLEIGDDLFQDNQQHQEQQQQQQHHHSSNVHHQSQQVNSDIIAVPTIANHAGVSKLIVSGSNPSISSISAKLDNRLNRQQQHPQLQQSNTNPYYYYKSAPEKVSEASSCNSSTASLLSSQQEQQVGPSSKATPSSSMVRSRSSSKMSTRSTTGKYKTRNLRSRLVDDLKSLAITNNSQTTSSSLSTSPSSSDLSDCDDQNSPRLDCLTLSNTSNLSNSPGGGQAAINSSLSGAIAKSKNTTRRLEIIRELVDTEKTHTEKLKQLNDLLYKPIKAENLIPPDQLKMVFSCHKALFKIHRQIYKKLVAAQLNISEYHQEPLVGKALIEIFDGELGRRLEKAASLFCACQSTNAELLNRITRKDTKSGEFLAQVSNQQMLGRLGIKDLLASCFQRLTKYPLLLDNLLKATPHTGSSGMIHSKSLSEGSIAICPVRGTTSNNNISESDNERSVSETSEQQQQEQQLEETLKLDEEVDNVNKNTTTLTSKTAATHQQQLSEIDNDEIITSPETSATITTPLTTPPTETTILTTTTTVPQPTTATIATSTSTTTNNVSAISARSALNDEYAYERLCIDRALYLSRQILIHVNESVNRAIAQTKLKEVWKKTDKNPALPVIDIGTQQLLHEGSLTLRLARRSFEVYVILLTHYLIILTREGQDKYKLKYFTSDGKSATQFSPIFNIDEHLVTRDSATDENGFYLLCKRKDDSRIYEFASQSPAERAKWKEKIHMAQLYNFAAVPDDDNTLTRYTELISLATSSNTPNNIEHSPTNNNIVAAYSSQ